MPHIHAGRIKIFGDIVMFKRLFNWLFKSKERRERDAIGAAIVRKSALALAESKKEPKPVFQEMIRVKKGKIRYTLGIVEYANGAIKRFNLGRQRKNNPMEIAL